MLQQTAVILFAAAIFNEFGKFGPDDFSQRQVKRQALRGSKNRIEILQLVAGRSARLEITLDHALTVQVQDSAFSKTTANGGTERLARSTTGFDQQHRFRDGTDGHRDDLLIAELGKLAGAAWPDASHATERSTSVP